jgi:hypothetical protein
MRNRGLWNQIGAPVSIVLAVMILSRVLYFHSSATVATLSGIVMFLAIGFGSFLIYPIGFFRGASLPERIVGCLATPLVWNGIEMYNVGEAFTPAESLFYGVNILSIGTVAGQFLIMGVCDFFCRCLKRRREGKETRVLSPFAALASAAGMLGIYFVLVWGEGVGLHYLLIDLYKRIFLTSL